VQMMASSYWEEIVYAAAPLASLNRQDPSAVFAWLHGQLPADGSKIDWANARGGHAHWKVEDDEQLTAMAIREICKRIQPGSVVEHVGDGLSPVSVSFGGADAAVVASALLEIPEHHYFVAGDRSWLVVVTTEGDLDALDR
jgi:hypothetical protein